MSDTVLSVKTAEAESETASKPQEAITEVHKLSVLLWPPNHS